MKKKHIFVVHEFSLISLAAFALIGRDLFIIKVEPIFPTCRSFLEGIARRLVAAGRAAWAIDLVPALQPLWDYHYRTYFYDVLGKIEPWQRQHFGFPATEDQLPDYSMSYKAAVADYFGTREWEILAIESLLARADADALAFHGVDGDLASATEAYCDRTAYPSPGLGGTINMPFNALVFLLYTTYSVAWILSRIRPGRHAPEAVLLAADFFNDVSDHELYCDFADHGPVVLVCRNKALAEAELPVKLGKCRRHQMWNGVFGFRDALEAIGLVVSDGARLFRFAGRTWPGLFRIIAGLPHRRMMYRLFFQRYRPKFFWGRDPYNPHHSLRRREANRVGCQSWAVLHAYSFYTGAYPAFRYLDFDKIFMMGRFLYESYYRESWNTDINVVTCTTFRADRTAVAARRTAPAGDILIMCSVYVGEAGLVDVVRALGAAFPEKSILLQVKNTFARDPKGLKFIQECTDGLENVKLVLGDVLKLFQKVRYAFSDPSTVFGEAIQFGLYSFFVDVSKEQKIVPVREFSGLCVSSGADAVERIKGIESGTWSYPIDDIARFVDLSGEPFTDAVLREAGFESKAEAVPAWTQSAKRPAGQT